MTDFARVIDPGRFNVLDPQPSLDHLRSKVGRKVKQLQSEFPGTKSEYLDTKLSIRSLGVTPQTTYLYIQGHHLFDNVIVPILNKVCNRLRMERQDEIYHTAVHHEQRRNEMSCYEHSLQDIRQMLKKNTGYKQSIQYQRIQQDVEHYLTSVVVPEGTGKQD
jgi:CRISPR/Cas system CSM-associated protein Csm5 (group 7 of RAMP superfamily)